MSDKTLIIKALDPNAKLSYSEYTDKFYIASLIEISNGYILSGVAEHREDKQEAWDAFFERLTNLKDDEFVVSSYKTRRREWRWNGAAFAECTRPEAMK